MTYVVEPIAHEGKSRWIVRCPDGHIANNYYHPTPESAENQATLCNVFAAAWAAAEEVRHAA